MDSISSIAIFEKKLQKIKISTEKKSAILQIVIPLFKNLDTLTVTNNINALVKSYAAEIYQVVENHLDDKAVCINYIEYVLQKVSSMNNTSK